MADVKHHCGNEGWYLNAVLPSVAVCAIGLLKWSCGRKSFSWLLRYGVVLTVAWNLIGRLAMYAYWTGHAGVAGRLRCIRWLEAANALLHPASWEGWLSCPGVIRPVLGTSLCPLALAVGLSMGLLWTMRARCRSEVATGGSPFLWASSRGEEAP